MLCIVVSILVNVGMWFERFVIVVTSLHRDFLPSSWDYFSPTFWDFATFIGSFGLFFTLFCLFVRFLPMVAMAEVKGVLPEAQAQPEEPPVEIVTEGPTQAPEQLFGVVGEFETPGQLMTAATRIRDAGYQRWDTHTPFPVHGMESAMGLGRSWVSALVLVMALSGAAVGMLGQWWVSEWAYPLVISGKPFFSWPAFIPITFECAVLGGAGGALIGFLLFARLPQHYHSVLGWRRFERASDDRFFLSIEATDPGFDKDEALRLLRQLGARHVELVES